MPKLTSQGGVKKIALNQIIETGNVREDYHDIPELARSIKTHGQLQPILVKAHGQNADGLDEYELVAGHRRIRAFRYLVDAGDDFSRIDAIVVQGDKLTLQLIENLQRSDLTPIERESGIYAMSKDGQVSSKDVAMILGKNEQYIWRNINAHKIRLLCDQQGIDTSGINTGTLCEIATAADGDIPELIKRIKEEGGTLAAARRVSRQYRGVVPAGTVEAPKAEAEPEETKGAWKLPDGERFDNLDDAVAAAAEMKDAERKAERQAEEDFDPPHRKVDINDVLVIIKKYIDSLDDMDMDSGEITNKKDAGWDIIALLHEGLK
jgi:ParB/RepB/Spo0J family partition protein